MNRDLGLREHEDRHWSNTPFPEPPAHKSDPAYLDPVCGMQVDPATAAHSYRLDDTDYYFCNADCRTKFIGDPAKYLDRSRKSVDGHPTAPHFVARAGGKGSGPVQCIRKSCNTSPEIARSAA